MDTEKYLYLLNYSSLFFVRSDKLEDEFEGSWTKADTKNRKKSAEPELGRRFTNDYAKILKNLKKKTFISCWHLRDTESQTMWNVYGRIGKSIALQSTYDRFHNAVTEHVTLGLVEYIDYDSESFYSEARKAASPFYFKRKEFSSERELRGTIQRHEYGAIDPDEKFDETEFGVDLVVELDDLIEKVIVAPGMEDWLFKLISSLTEKFGYSFPVIRSRIDATPVF